MSVRIGRSAPRRTGRNPRTRCAKDPSALRLAVGALIYAGLALACASAPPSAAPTPGTASAARLDDAPDWVVRGCRAYWPDTERRRRIVCGVGSAPAHRNRVATRETAIARARSEIARSLRVTIESVVRLQDGGANDDGQLDTIVHQLSSASLRGAQLEEVWSASGGETHALVSLDVDRVRESVRSHRALTPAQREDLAERAAAAFAALDAAFEAER